MLLTTLAVMLAQPATPPADEESKTIVVTGQKNTQERVKEFVDALTWTPVGNRPARFEREVCPIAVGLSPRHAEAVANRIRVVAKEVGIWVGGPNCVPNVVVVVTSHKNAFLAELRRRHPNYFQPMSRSKIRQLVRQAGPATAWQLKGPPVSAGGNEIMVDPNLDVYVNRTTEAASRINLPARPQFDAAVVVVERGALVGISATQLADYVALRALTGADPARLGDASAPTILRVLDAPMGSAVPITMTEWDLGFLRGYYQSPRNLTTASQRSSIRQNVAKEIDAKPGE